MWYSSPSNFNDPFDCALTIDQKKFDESAKHVIQAGVERGVISAHLLGMKRIYTESDQQLYSKVRELIKGVTRRLGICCFSEGPRSILMWSHYANYHKGFCIEYSAMDDTMLSEEVSSVIYTKQLPSLSMSDFSPEKSVKTAELLWRTKATCWRYEKEWRALAPEGGRSYLARGPIKSIIFGERMLESDRQQVHQALIGQPKVMFKEAYLHESKFAMRIRRSG